MFHIGSMSATAAKAAAGWVRAPPPAPRVSDRSQPSDCTIDAPSSPPSIPPDFVSASTLPSASDLSCAQPAMPWTSTAGRRGTRSGAPARAVGGSNQSVNHPIGASCTSSQVPVPELEPDAPNSRLQHSQSSSLLAPAAATRTGGRVATRSLSLSHSVLPTAPEAAAVGPRAPDPSQSRNRAGGGDCGGIRWQTARTCTADAQPHADRPYRTCTDRGDLRGDGGGASAGSLLAIGPSGCTEAGAPAVSGTGDLTCYVRDAVTRLQRKPADRSHYEVLGHYLESVLSGDHVMGRSFEYVSLNPYNRRCFIRIFQRVYANISASQAFSVSSFHELLRLLCPDFPSSVVRNASFVSDPRDDKPQSAFTFGELSRVVFHLFFFSEFMNHAALVFRSLDLGANGEVLTGEFCDRVREIINANQAKFSCPSMLEIDKVEQQIRDSVGDGTTFNLYCLSLINLLTGRRKLKSFGHFADS